MTEPEYIAWVTQYHKRFLWSLRRYIKDHAEDLLQEVIISFLRSKEYEKYGNPVGDERAFRGVFYSRLRNRMTNYIRTRTKGLWKRQSPLRHNWWAEENRVPAAERTDELAAVEIIIQHLPAQQKVVMRGIALGWNEQEIAKELGVTQQAVSALKRRALKRLREEVA